MLFSFFTLYQMHRLLTEKYESHSRLLEHVFSGEISDEDGFVVSSLDSRKTRRPKDVDHLAKLHLRAILDTVRFRSP